MIIRSQDKRIIIPLNQPIYVEMVIDKWKVSTESFFLGEYSTKEKAIKVLDIIQDAYCKMKSSDCVFCGSSIDLCKASQEEIDNFIETNRKLYVFDMPQDSEV